MARAIDHWRNQPNISQDRNTPIPATAMTDINQIVAALENQNYKQALKTLKVLDPAVGSGAFPLGMMQTILVG